MQDMLLARRLVVMMMFVGRLLPSRILVRGFLNEGVCGLAWRYLAC